MAAAQRGTDPRDDPLHRTAPDQRSAEEAPQDAAGYRCHDGGEHVRKESQNARAVDSIIDSGALSGEALQVIRSLQGDEIGDEDNDEYPLRDPDWDEELEGEVGDG